MQQEKLYNKLTLVFGREFASKHLQVKIDTLMSEGFATVDDLHDKKKLFMEEAYGALNSLTDEIHEAIGAVESFYDRKIEDYELL